MKFIPVDSQLVSPVGNSINITFLCSNLLTVQDILPSFRIIQHLYMRRFESMPPAPSAVDT
jgi:hypothetical protein